MRFSTLSGWLGWQESLHPLAMDLGLERCREVVAALDWSTQPFTVITVAGTNGKGSTVAFLEAMLSAAGRRIGTYTSPHLVRYNERIRIEGAEARDRQIMESFDRLDRARGDTTLTYFEFGTLAAVDLFRREGVEVAVLEVGIGGRLDAVNLIDPDIAVITAIDIDHAKWLGPDRASIAREKAGIARPGKPLVVADRDPPPALRDQAVATGARCFYIGREFDAECGGPRWRWRGPGGPMADLPLPALAGRFQVDNAAGAIMAARCVDLGVHRGLDQGVAGVAPLARPAVHQGLIEVQLRGRFERQAGRPRRILDIAHNPHAARSLAATLRQDGCDGRTLAVVGMLGEKDFAAVLACLFGAVDGWYVGRPRSERAADPAVLVECLASRGQTVAGCHQDIESAYNAALQDASAEDRVLVFGSCYTVGEVLALQAARPVARRVARPGL